MLSSLTDVGWM